MPYYRCKTCGRTREFKPAPPWDSTCTGCFQKNTWLPYAGPVADAILSEEDRQHEILTGEYRRLKAGIDTATAAYEEREKQYRFRSKIEKSERQQLLDEIQLCHDTIASLHAQMKPLAAQLDDLGERSAVKKDAVTAHKAAASQNELFVGNRQYVSKFKSGTGTAKILDVPNWSWGLNCAWVEGGISAKAHFTVKIDSSNPYTQIPLSIQQALTDTPRMNSDDFLDLCEAKGKGSLLWYDRDGASRPTWTALEMATLLRARYTFQFGDVVMLTPPH